MATIADKGNQYNTKLHEDIFADEVTTDALVDEDEERRRQQREKNVTHAQCRWNAAEHQQCINRNLNGDFALAVDCEYATPITNIMEATFFLQKLAVNPETERLSD